MSQTNFLDGSAAVSGALKQELEKGCYENKQAGSQILYDSGLDSVNSPPQIFSDCLIVSSHRPVGIRILTALEPELEKGCYENKVGGSQILYDSGLDVINSSPQIFSGDEFFKATRNVSIKQRRASFLPIILRLLAGSILTRC